jgi:hypothetical protein
MIMRYLGGGVGHVATQPSGPKWANEEAAKKYGFEDDGAGEESERIEEDNDEASSGIDTATFLHEADEGDMEEQEEPPESEDEVDILYYGDEDDNDNNEAYEF